MSDVTTVKPYPPAPAANTTANMSTEERSRVAQVIRGRAEITKSEIATLVRHHLATYEQQFAAERIVDRSAAYLIKVIENEALILTTTDAGNFLMVMPTVDHFVPPLTAVEALAAAEARVQREAKEKAARARWVVEHDQPFIVSNIEPKGDGAAA